MNKTLTVVLTTLLLGSANLVLADGDVLNKTTDVLRNGKKIGYITVLTPVKKVGKSNVKVKGFRLENYPQLIVRDMKRGEVYVEFNEEREQEALKTFKVVKSYEDDYGEAWQEVEGIVNIDINTLTNDIKPLYKEAKTIYEQSCSMCHHLPAPNHFTVNQWPQQIESMMEQIPLDKPIKALVTKYLQHHAVDAK